MRFAAALDDAGALDHACELRGALAISTLPGEILGEIRIVLRQIAKAEFEIEPDFRRMLREAIDYIDQVLR